MNDKTTPNTSNKLFIINGLFSFIHALSAAPTREDEELSVLVLFQYDKARDQNFIDKIHLLRPNATVFFLHEPSTYITKLSDRKFMQSLCAAPKEIRMFFTHNYWLHNAVASVYPKARFFLFEEGTASFYPGLLEKYSFISQIQSISASSYLGRFSPLDCLTRPDLFKTPPPSLLRTLISKLKPKRISVDLQKIHKPIIIFIEQYFHKKGSLVKLEDMTSLYADAVKKIIDKGYHVLYRFHPREKTNIFHLIREALHPEQKQCLSLLDEDCDVLESIITFLDPVAVVGVSSTCQLTIPDLYGIPSFRVETHLALRMCQDIPIERRGLVCNHFAFLSLLPTLADLPPADRAIEAKTIFQKHFKKSPVNIDDQLIRGLAKSDFGPEYPQLIEKILDPGISTVSFDVFDTLVWRPTSHPSDLFALLDPDFVPDLGMFLRFSSMRANLYNSLRQHAKLNNTEKEEYTLDELYDFARQAYKLDEDLVKRMRKAEFELERHYLLARDSCVSLMLIAARANKKTILVSDTYYEEKELRELLNNVLPYLPDNVFSSCTEGCTKRSGALFDVVLQRMKLTPSEILHIGDNTNNDIEQPKSKGFLAEHYPAPFDCFNRPGSSTARLWLGVRLEVGMKLLLGLFAGRFFDNPFRPVDASSLVNGEPFWLGYGILAPALLAWTQWILKTATNLHTDRLLFIARDGWLPFQIAQSLQAKTEKMNSVAIDYIYASRKAYMPLYQSTPSEVSFTKFAHGLNANNTVSSTLKNRFGERCDRLLTDFFIDNGFPNLNEAIGQARMPLFESLLNVANEEIAKVRKIDRRLAREYFISKLQGSATPAIVDTGYSGSSQRALMLASQNRVDGFYFVTMEHNVEYANILGYQAHDFTENFEFFKNGAFIEYLATPPDLMECIGYGPLANGQIGPVLGEAKPYDPVIDQVHQGIQAFLSEFFLLFDSRLELLQQRACIATRMLNSFVSNPGKLDATMFAKVVHEDNIGAMRPRLLDYWEAGRKVLEK